MELDIKDIEAISKSRANRTLPSKLKNMMYGGIFIAVIGVIAWMFRVKVFNTSWITLIVVLVGLVLLWVGTIKADNRRKDITAEIKRVWKEENQSKVESK